MKTLSLTSLALATVLTANIAHAYTINDTYIGDRHGGWGDVIGSTDLFNLHGLNAWISGTTLTVDIYTNYAGRADDGLFSSSTNTEAGMGKGIGYGDLLLSSTADSFSHGFALDNRWSTTGGTGTLYAANNHFLSSDDFVSIGHRSGYDVAVDTSGAVINQGSGAWSVNEANGYISMTMDLAGSGLLNSSDLYFGWGYTCANDVIRGHVDVNEITTTDVPEPGVLSLVGLGLIGTLTVRRRRRSA